MTTLNPYLLQAMAETHQRELLEDAQNRRNAALARAARKAERRARRSRATADEARPAPSHGPAAARPAPAV